MLSVHKAVNTVGHELVVYLLVTTYVCALVDIFISVYIIERYARRHPPGTLK